VTGGEAYLYTTQVGWTSVPVWRSEDHATWTWVGDALPVLPSWAAWGSTWAPGVIQVGDRFVLYFTARHAASGRQAVGVAEATRPEGPFTPRGEPLVADLAAGGSIDASPFRDDDGTLYLYWKVDANAIGEPSSLWGARLSSDGTHLAGPPVRLLDEDARWQHPTVENPAMVRGDGQHLLFYSGGWWESVTYGIGFAACDGPLGPCTNATVDAPWLTQRSALVGIGGASFFDDERGTAHMVAHAWTYPSVGYAAGGARRLLVAAVRLGRTPSWTLYADVAPTDVHADAIEGATLAELVGGTGGGLFRPGEAVSRGQAATMVRRLLVRLGSPLPVTTDAFVDDDGSVHEPALDVLGAAGIVQGRTDRTVGPDGPVTRGQLASMIVAAVESAKGRTLDAGSDAFVDDDGNVHEPALDALGDAGIVRGRADGTVGPDEPVTRAQAASILVGALVLVAR
jgi:hypothetical protein